MRVRDFAIALAATAFAAAPALAQQGSWSSNHGSQGYTPQGYNQGWNGSNNTNGELSQGTIQHIQQELQQRGFHHGNIDGTWGRETESALRDFQQQHGIPASGQLDYQTFAGLGMIGTQGQRFGNNRYNGEIGNNGRFSSTGRSNWTGSATDNNRFGNNGYNRRNGTAYNPNNQNSQSNPSYTGNQTGVNTQAGVNTPMNRQNGMSGHEGSNANTGNNGYSTSFNSNNTRRPDNNLSNGSADTGTASTGESGTSSGSNSSTGSR